MRNFITTSLSRNIATLVVLFVAFNCIQLNAQILPDSFILKINYSKVKNVKYEMTDAGQQACLTLQELSQYHDYSQITKETELIDLDGDLLTETEFIVEENVRDDWMEGYHKIIIGKDSVYIIGDNQVVRYSNAKDSSDSLFFTEEEAAMYEYYKFGDEGYLDNLIDFLSDSGIVYTNIGGIVTMYFEGATVMYDHNTKVTIATQFDSLGIKVKEITCEYFYIGDGVYEPSTETEIEWINTTNNCCVRKTSSIQYVGYSRVLMQGGLLAMSNSNEDHNQNKDDRAQLGLEISFVNESNQIFIQVNKELNDEEYEFVIYDVTGKKIGSQFFTGSHVFDLPMSARQGVYLIHIYKKRNNEFVLGKAVLSVSK